MSQTLSNNQKLTKTKKIVPPNQVTLFKSIQNQNRMTTRAYSVDIIGEKYHSKHTSKKLESNKVSPLEVQNREDNAYLKSSIKYFQKQNQRLLRLISEKEIKISGIKLEIKDVLIKQKNSLLRESCSFQKTFRSRSKNKLQVNNEKRELESIQKYSNSNKSIDKGLKYLQGLKKIKNRLTEINFESAQKFVCKTNPR